MDYELFTEEFIDWAKKYKYEINENVEFTEHSGPVGVWLCGVLFNEHEPVKGLIALGIFDDMEFGESPSSYLPSFIGNALGLLPDCKWHVFSVESDDDWKTAKVIFKHKTKGTDEFIIDDIDGSDWLTTGTLDLLLKVSKRYSKYRLRAFVSDNFFTIAALKRNAYEDLEDILYDESAIQDLANKYTYEEEIDSLVFPYELYRVVPNELVAKLKSLKQEGRGYPVVLGDKETFYHMQLNLSKFNIERTIDLETASEKGDKEAEINLKKEINAVKRAPHILNEKRNIDIQALVFDGYAIGDILAKVEQQTANEWDGEGVDFAFKPKVKRKNKNVADNIKVIELDEDGLPSIEHEDAFFKYYRRSVYVANIPTDKVWNVPAFLNMQAFDPELEFSYQCEANHAPDYLLLASALKHWDEQFGVQLIEASCDSIKILAKNLPTSRKQATDLAYEHYYLCPNVFNSNIESIGDLADVLMKQRIWVFEWDWLLNRRSFLNSMTYLIE